MSEPKNVFMPLVELPSGVCLRPDLVSFIARKDLGKFMVFFQQTGSAVEIGTADLDVLKGLGIVQTPAADPETTQPQGTIAQA